MHPRTLPRHTKGTLNAVVAGVLLAVLMMFATRSFSDSTDSFASDHQNEREMVQALEAYAVYKMGQYNDAFARFLALAEQGNVQGMLNAANMYAAGVGVEENQIAATRWYQSAAEKGSEIAMEEFAMRLGQGLGIEQDVDAAVRWRKRLPSQKRIDAKNKTAAKIDMAAAIPAIEEKLKQLDKAAQEKSVEGVVGWINPDSRLLAVLPGTRHWTTLDKSQLAALWQSGFDRIGDYQYRRSGAAHKESDGGFIQTRFVIEEEWHREQEPANSLSPIRVQITNDLLVTMIEGAPQIYQWKLHIRQSGE